MCFTPKVPEPPAPPPVPDRNAAEANAAAEEQRRMADQARGRQATVLTTPLGATGSSQNRRRTTITGM